MKPPIPQASNCVFREQFHNYSTVSDNGGIVVASTIAKGISPTGATGRVTYHGTELVGYNTDQLTWVFRFRTGATLGANRFLASAENIAATNRKWSLSWTGGLIPIFQLADTPTTGASYAYNGNVVTTNTEYCWHIVYNGSLAANDRVKWYNLGLLDGTGIANPPIPARLSTGTLPIEILNINGGNAAPSTDFIMREVRIHNRAFSAAEVADDYANMAYRGVTP